jgi:hypothetical protein
MDSSRRDKFELPAFSDHREERHLAMPTYAIESLRSANSELALPKKVFAKIE